MSSTTPTAVTPRTVQTARIYVTGQSGGLTIAVGAVPAGSFVVAVVMVDSVNGSNGHSGPFFSTGGGTLYSYLTNVQQSFTTGEDPGHAGFLLGYGFVPPALANNAGFEVSCNFNAPAGSHEIVNLQVAVYDGVDPTVPVVSGHIDDTAWSTPSVNPSVGGVALHVHCFQDVGYPNPVSGLAPGPFDTLEQDDSVPYQLAASSEVEDVPPGPTTPRPVNVTPWGPAGRNPYGHLRSAVLVMPVKHADSAGDLNS